MKYIKLLLIILCLVTGVTLKAANKDSLDVIKAASAFVTAFNNFDWPSFKASFMDDATIFYPMWEKPKRITGRADIEAAWTNIFPEFEDPNNQRKLQINPKDIHIQIYGRTAIVTFHLGNGANNLARRTLVMIKSKKIWKIAHLHASIVSNENTN
ncbi:MAG: nuclear transport factor 2 family protein [Ferruginibacter sp.]